MKKTKKNPADLTLRNLRSLKKRVEKLEWLANVLGKDLYRLFEIVHRREVI